MQLISAPAPVMKMKGLQRSEINWVSPPFFCLGTNILDMYLKRLADRGSAVFPVCFSPPVNLHPLPQHCYHCSFRNFNMWRAAFSDAFRRAEVRNTTIRADVLTRRTFGTNYHAAHDLLPLFFFFTIVGRRLVMTSNVQMYIWTKGKISREIKFANVWKRCFCGRSAKMLLARVLSCWEQWFIFQHWFEWSEINYVVLLLAGWKCFHVLSLRAQASDILFCLIWRTHREFSAVEMHTALRSTSFSSNNVHI